MAITTFFSPSHLTKYGFLICKIDTYIYQQDTLISDSSLLADASYVLCLDTLGNGDKLHLHVSKPPKEGSSGHTLLQVNTVIKL